MQIRTLQETDTEAAARLLVEGFKVHWPASWPDMEAALEEVYECLEPEYIALGAISEEGALLGWIGGRPEYDGNVWELHPLVVDPAVQGRGIGRALVRALEVRVAERGALTLYLGTDDEDFMTSLGGVDLYDNLLDRIAAIRNLRGHPFEFYQKMGFIITGVVPDANGPGKPDILMAKRVRRP